jgi:hypothetical protein
MVCSSREGDEAPEILHLSSLLRFCCSYKEHAKGVPCCDQSSSIDPSAPTNPTNKKTSESTRIVYDASERSVGSQIGIFQVRRCNTSGSVKVNGILVSAPISASKSLKKGTALATMYDEMDKMSVMYNQRRRGRYWRLGTLHKNKRSIEEHRA